MDHAKTWEERRCCAFILSTESESSRGSGMRYSFGCKQSLLGLAPILYSIQLWQSRYFCQSRLALEPVSRNLDGEL